MGWADSLAVPGLRDQIVDFRLAESLLAPAPETSPEHLLPQDARHRITDIPSHRVRCIRRRIRLAIQMPEHNIARERDRHVQQERLHGQRLFTESPTPGDVVPQLAGRIVQAVRRAQIHHVACAHRAGA